MQLNHTLQPDKAISIRQPWAWAIMHGLKTVENRSWVTRVRGRIWVHAGRLDAKDQVDPGSWVCGTCVRAWVRTANARHSPHLAAASQSARPPPPHPAL